SFRCSWKWRGCGKPLRVRATPDPVEHATDRASEIISIMVRHAFLGPHDPRVHDRPNLRKHPVAPVPELDLRYNVAPLATEYVNVKLPEDERRRLRIRPRNPIVGRVACIS